jgi:hypothetical protein
MTTDGISEGDRIDADTRTSDVPTLIACSSETSLHSLDQQAPFKLSDRCDDREYCLTQWRPGIDLLTKGDELNIEVPEQLEGLD